MTVRQGESAHGAGEGVLQPAGVGDLLRTVSDRYRRPNLIIGDPQRPYLLRWHLLRWRGWQLALHRILRDDDDRALHDHSGDNVSIILWGRYFEVLKHGWHNTGELGRWRWPLIPYFRRAETPHRLVLDRGRPVWTLWLRWPPRREWGFHCRAGWRHWREYTGQVGHYDDAGASFTGKGCG